MKHLLCNLHGDVDDIVKLKNAMLSACSTVGAMVVGIVDHKFYPTGYSLVILLGESHASVHTYPESNDAHIDYFSCAKDPKIDLFVDELRGFGFAVYDINVIDRSFEKEF